MAEKAKLTHYEKNKKYYKRYNRLYYLKKIMDDPEYNKKNQKKKLKKTNINEREPKEEKKQECPPCEWNPADFLYNRPLKCKKCGTIT